MYPDDSGGVQMVVHEYPVVIDLKPDVQTGWTGGLSTPRQNVGGGAGLDCIQ